MKLGTLRRKSTLMTRELELMASADVSGHDHRVTPLRSPGREIDGINGDQDEQQKGSQGPQDSNEGAAQPEKKKKKVKRSRKVTFDDVSWPVWVSDTPQLTSRTWRSNTICFEMRLTPRTCH